MANNAKRDENRVVTLIAVSKIDGKTIVLIKVNPATHAVKVESP